MNAPDVSAERELRNAFGVYPTGVTVVTCTTKDGRLIGVTANSFVSLSLLPPLVSVALHRSARHLSAFLESKSFAINVLRSDQKTLSNHFARPSACTWESVRYQRKPTGHLVLEDVSAFFLCNLVAQHDVGDHRLLVGEIHAYGCGENSSPLVFQRGRYGMFSPTADVPPIDAAELWMSGAPISWG
jgi:flavin reductase (DIM6/NTAB) family NADH-FMN oxidoreductase RutF